MADYTDIDKLRELAEAATAGPWYLDGDAQSEGHLFVGNRADGRTHGLWEIVHMTAEKMGRGHLGELTPEARSRRLADAAFIAAASPDVILALIADLAYTKQQLELRDLACKLGGDEVRRERARADALQARIDAADVDQLPGLTKGSQRAALIEARYGPPLVYIYDPNNYQAQNEPTHERVVWYGPWQPEPRCPGCRQRLRDLRAANDNHTDCSDADAKEPNDA